MILKNITSKPPFLQGINLWWIMQATLYALLITDGAELQRLMKEQRRKAWTSSISEIMILKVNMYSMATQMSSHLF